MDQELKIGKRRHSGDIKTRSTNSSENLRDRTKDSNRKILHATRKKKSESVERPTRSGKEEATRHVPIQHHEENNKEIKVLDFNKLKLMNESVTEDFVFKIMQDESGFSQALNDSALYTNVETFEIILSVILKSIDFNKEAKESVFLLNKVKSTEFFSKGFVNYYTKLMTKLGQLDDDKATVAFRDSVELLKHIMERFPSTLEMIVIMYSLVKLIMDQNEIIDDKLRNTFRDLSVMVENGKRRQYQVIKTHKTVKTFSAPPNNFREMGVFPQFDKELNQTKEPYLRPIVISGGFQDVEHYLDVHFRLLREDFVRPLRDGIREYKENLKYGKLHFKLTDLRIYRGVQLIKMEGLNNGSIFWIKFDLEKLKHVNWQTSKRFIHGSMLFLSNDDFKSAQIATVEISTPENILNGMVGVMFESPSQIQRLLNSKTFVMLESSALFEAYKHVLQCLITIDPRHFPFKEAIVFCQPVGNPPKYLDDLNARLFSLTSTREMINAQLSYDKQHFFPVERAWSPCEMNEDKKDEDDHNKESRFDILDENAWPSASDLKLDESQFKALRHCLTSDISIIQGPPGTGKTFLGLKLVEVLLANWNRWNEEEKPMLVVCYTNHALDQFLGGIHEFLGEGIVRVGGRSQCHVLEPFYLKNLRRRSSKVPTVLTTSKNNLHTELTNIPSEINRNEKLLANLTNGTIKEYYLQEVMTEDQQRSLHSISYAANCIHHWLEITTTDSSSLSLMTSKKVQLSYDLCSMVDVAEDFEKHLKDPEEIQMILEIKEAIKRKLAVCGLMRDAEADSVTDVTQLNIKDRWRLYNYWLNKFRNKLRENNFEKIQHYKKCSENLKTINYQIDEWIMNSSKVIGMTTTCAARYRSVLEKIQPKVIIVEEAAEVLESHIVSSINSECQHLILIGDHLQLRPSVNVYRLETKYNLNVSLFERLILNDFPYVTLEKQYRMRSDIGDFARITYPQLRDNESLLEVENIRGISSNVFFVNHNQLEAQDDELKSASNAHEAAFLARFSKYLLQQGYTNNQITILTPYSGQMLEIRKHIPINDFPDLRVCLVDNYQGEENDIILLSLVRSNSIEKIGFLKEFNRLNVAMTRAKKGLFVIGNFDMLKTKSDFVRRMYKLAIEKNPPVLGTSLSLYCQNHPCTKICVTTANDFDLFPEGGCTLPCRFRLTCGHTCTRKCHSEDREHSEFKCFKIVLKKLPKCQHQLTMKCHVDPKKIVCLENCSYVLPCGHPCKRKCGENHTNRCLEEVLKVFKCGHKTNLPCFLPTYKKTCSVKCVDTLACGHQCNGTCGRCFNGKRHIPCSRLMNCGKHRCTKLCHEECGKCSDPVGKFVPSCRHYHTMACHESPARFVCRERGPRVHPYGQRQRYAARVSEFPEYNRRTESRDFFRREEEFQQFRRAATHTERITKADIPAYDSCDPYQHFSGAFSNTRIDNI